MRTWIIEPRDPLIARDGRPFSAGGRAKSLPFPYPSTTTGGTRTRAGLRNGEFDTTLISHVKQIAVRGPLLTQLNNTGVISEWFVHAPADALLFEVEGKDARALVHQLTPSELPDGALTNLPNHLQPVYLTVDEKSKPLTRAPRYWRWTVFQDWLINPAKRADGGKFAGAEHQLSLLGHGGTVSESRTHVQVKSATQTAEEGDLFQTSGLEFAHRLDEESCAAERLALVVQTNAIESLDGLAHLGGERRFVCWREIKAPDDLFNSKCPSTIQDVIVPSKSCRVVLLTPAHFKEGVLPEWLRDGKVHGFKPELKAIANNRYQVVSGWDLEKKASDPSRKYGRPKPTRRLVPAGSVFWFDLSTGTAAQIKTWVEKIWMQSVSDNSQDQQDGFGLAVLGTWNK